MSVHVIVCVFAVLPVKRSRDGRIKMSITRSVLLDRPIPSFNNTCNVFRRVFSSSAASIRVPCLF
ncbi:MAG: hypothetical protein ACFFAS_11670 [Promethearchaeota archaeon]